jgi:hypothetical protein
MADTPTTSCPVPAESESSPVAQRDSSSVSAQSISDTCSPELADGVDPLSMFESEHPGGDETIVVAPQPPAYMVTVRAALRTSSTGERSDTESVPLRASHTYTTTSGCHSDRETSETLRHEESELVVAQNALHRLCSDLEARLVRTEESLHELCNVAEGTPLQRLHVGIDSRLSRTEHALERTGEQTVELGRHIGERFARTEDALRRLHETVAETNKLRELCASIDRRLSRTEEALKRTETLVVDRTLQQLSARIDVRVAETGDAIHRIERSLENAQLQHLSARIAGRFAQADERLSRLEALLEAGAAAAKATQGSGSPAEVIAVQRFLVPEEQGWRRPRVIRHRVVATMAIIRFAATQMVARARLSLRPRAAIATTGDTSSVQRIAKRCAPVVALFATIAVVTNFRNDARVKTAKPLPVEQLSEQEINPGPVASPVISPVIETLPVAAPAAVRPANAVRLPAALPARQAPVVEPLVQSLPFLGSLSVASEPPGATVFINGQLVGVTPLDLTDRRAGSLALQITRDGFERWTAAIQVPAGRITRVNATLRPSAP